MKLSVVIPCYNERNTIAALIEAVRASPIQDVEIIVVDDFSTDGTAALLKETLAHRVDKIIYHPENYGKGAALRSGLQAATGELVVIQDADLEYDPQEYPALLEPILAGKADAVFGSGFMGGRPHRVVYFLHMIANKCLTLLSNMLTNVNLTDMETCYKAFKADVIKNMPLEENGFGIEPEITAKLAKRGYRIYEVGISYSGRTYEEGKKIGFEDAVRAIYAILKYNLTDF
ncbi:MAG: glycosyl transferase [Acidobacteria bacterium]|nr:MAG: glycosyl transferase [Acidobacteriota bacterium]